MTAAGLSTIVMNFRILGHHMSRLRLGNALDHIRLPRVGNQAVCGKGSMRSVSSRTNLESCLPQSTRAP